MAAVRTATVTWTGTLAEGSGTVTAGTSELFVDLPVSWASRTEQPDGRTSPEELLAAAHASCFAMALSGGLVRGGTPADHLHMSATVTFDKKTRVVTAPKAVLGRSRECDVRLPDANSSRRHAEIRYEDDAWWIVDLGSTNGTILNGKRAKSEQLQDGDVITLGSTDIVFGIRS